MSKGLEALEKIKREAGTPYFSSLYDIDMWREDFAIVEKELKELEERREMMRRFNEACAPMTLDNETEKKLKALEIIKETWGDSILCDIEKGFIIGCPYTKLPDKEKIDLLKEILL